PPGPWVGGAGENEPPPPPAIGAAPAEGNGEAAPVEACGAEPLTGGKGDPPAGGGAGRPGSGAGEPPRASAGGEPAASRTSVSGTIKRLIIKAVSPAGYVWPAGILHRAFLRFLPPVNNPQNLATARRSAAFRANIRL